MQYQKNSPVVDARQYDGDVAIRVVSKTLGEQTANKGDWLVGSQPGEVTVVDQASFAAQYVSYDATAEAAKVAAAEKVLADLHSQVDSLSGSNAMLGAEVASLTTDKAAQAAQIASLQAALDDEKSKSADLQTKLDALVAAEKQRAEAESAIDAVKATVSSSTTT